MPEPKTTSETTARGAELKKLEADLAKGREAAKTQIVTLIDAHVAELRELGFYTRSSKRTEHRRGKPGARPRTSRPIRSKQGAPPTPDGAPSSVLSFMASQPPGTAQGLPEPRSLRPQIERYFWNPIVPYRLAIIGSVAPGGCRMTTAFGARRKTYPLRTVAAAQRAYRCRRCRGDVTERINPAGSGAVLAGNILYDGRHAFSVK